MSNTATLHQADIHAAHDAHHEHHHHETFISKYVFSQDHKMIARQFFNYRYYLGYYWWIIFCIVSFAIGLPQFNLSMAGRSAGSLG